MKDFFYFDPKLLLFGFFIVFFASYGQTFFISIYNTEIRQFYKLTNGEFGLLYALGTLCSSFFLIGFARLIDHIDLRIYSFIISIGLAIACLGMYFHFTSLFFLFLIIFALRFFGQGAMSHAGETTMARYFGKNRGKAISVSTFGGMTGVMILPIIAVQLTDYFGWKNVWLISSASIIIFFLPILFLSLHDQSLRHSTFKESSKKLLNNKKWKTIDVALDKKFYIYLPISIASSFISTGLTFHQIFIINEKGWTLEMLANGFVFLGTFSIIGLLFGGPIVDKYDPRKVILFSLFPLLLAIFIIFYFENYFFMYVYMSLLGINLGIGTPFVGSLWAELYGLQSLGTVKALLHALGVFSSALSPVIFGYIIDFGYDINALVIICFLIILFSTFLPFIFNKI